MLTYILKSNNLYKIGKTKDIEQRLKSYHIHSPGFQLIRLIESDIEKELHNLYKVKRKKGEWFKLTEEDILEIDDRLIESNLRFHY